MNKCVSLPAIKKTVPTHKNPCCEDTLFATSSNLWDIFTTTLNSEKFKTMNKGRSKYVTFYVGSLSYRATSYNVRRVFEKTLQIKIDEVVIARSSDGVSRGCGFVTVRWNELDDALFTQILLKKYSHEFKNNEKWYDVLTTIMSRKSICGRDIQVELARNQRKNWANSSNGWPTVKMILILLLQKLNDMFTAMERYRIPDSRSHNLRELDFIKLQPTGVGFVFISESQPTGVGLLSDHNLRELDSTWKSCDVSNDQMVPKSRPHGKWENREIIVRDHQRQNFRRLCLPRLKDLPASFRPIESSVYSLSQHFKATMDANKEGWKMLWETSHRCNETQR